MPQLEGPESLSCKCLIFEIETCNFKVLNEQMNYQLVESDFEYITVKGKRNKKKNI